MHAALPRACSLQLHHRHLVQQQLSTTLSSCTPVLHPLHTRHQRQEWNKQGSCVCGAAPSNLGQLSTYQSVVGTEDPSAETWSTQLVSAESFANRGLYVDMPVVLSSGFLFFVLLAVAFQRVLGLDRLVAQFMLQQQEKRRQDTMDARQRLEKSWQSQQEGDAGNNSDGGHGRN